MINNVLKGMAAAGVMLCLAAALAVAQQPSAKEMIKDWPDTAKRAANDMLSKYGQPDGVTPDRLVWQNKSPWRTIVVYREEVPHNFPMRHMDVLEQSIPYDVPPDKFDELAEYDGSVIVERTKGTMAARCDREPANILALNLAHDIITEKRNVQEAREYYANAIKAFKEKDQMDPYMRKLQFQVPGSIDKTQSPDKAVIGK